MYRLITAATLAAAALLGSAASAQGVNARQGYQQERIDHGVRSGRLTPGEANRLERQQGRIDRTEDRMRYRNGGRLNRYQRARLHARQDRASHHIYRAKHNGRHY